MQAVKDKIHDMQEMRKAKAEAKAEEKAEKEMAKARMEVAHEVRMAKEAEAAMDLHVNKAAEKAERVVAKQEVPGGATPYSDAHGSSATGAGQYPNAHGAAGPAGGSNYS